MYTKQKIMDSAFNLFAFKGKDFSLNEIANEIGIKKASLYAHFGDGKDQILHAVIEKEIEEYFLKIQDKATQLINNGEDNVVILEKTFLDILGYYDSRAKLLFWKRVLLFPTDEFDGDLMSRVQELSRERFESIKNIFRDCIQKEIIKSVDINVVTLSYFSLIQGTLSEIIIYDDENVITYFKGIWDLFWSGLTNVKE
jgi:AcrR family transcriptional regulator